MKVVQSGASEMAKRCGVEITLVGMEAQRERELIRTGEIDGVFTRTSEFEITPVGLTRLSEPTASFPIYAYATRKNIVIEGWDSLNNYSVAYITDNRYIHSKVNSIIENTFSFSKISSALNFIEAGRADIFVHTPIGVESLLRSDELKYARVKALHPKVDIQNTYIHVLPKHKKLATCLNIALKNMKEGGTYQKLVDRLFKGS